jgi:hypothetical protein
MAANPEDWVESKCSVNQRIAALCVPYNTRPKALGLRCGNLDTRSCRGWTRRHLSLGRRSTSASSSVTIGPYAKRDFPGFALQFSRSLRTLGVPYGLGIKEKTKLRQRISDSHRAQTRGRQKRARARGHARRLTSPRWKATSKRSRSSPSRAKLPTAAVSRKLIPTIIAAERCEPSRAFRWTRWFQVER